MIQKLAGKVAVVTGSSVLSRNLALVLAARGVKVAVLDLKEERAREVADEITATGGKAVAIGCDVLQVESLGEALQKML